MNKEPVTLTRELAIGAITAIIITALLLGYNSTLLVGGIAAIAGIAGYSIRKENSTK